MLINKARFARPCVEPIGRLKTTFHRAQRGELITTIPEYLICFLFIMYKKHNVEQREFVCSPPKKSITWNGGSMREPLGSLTLTLTLISFSLPLPVQDSILYDT